MSILRSVVFATLCILSGTALAQSYPGKPVKIVVGFAPGSATDIIMRLVADQFSTSMGQSFIVENKPGAGGSVGAAQVKAGKLRAIAVAIPKRSEFLPQVPTMAEQGYPGFESVGGIGLAAPARTPAAILDRLNAELRKMLADPVVKARLNTLAFDPVGDSREEFTAFVKSEIEKWTKVAKDSGARLD